MRSPRYPLTLTLLLLTLSVSGPAVRGQSVSGPAIGERDESNRREGVYRSAVMEISDQPRRTTSGGQETDGTPMPRASDVERGGVERPASSTPSIANQDHPSEPTPLPRRADGEASTVESPGLASSRGLTTVIGSLAIVLGLFFLLTWFLRRHQPAAQRWLPKEVVEVLGRTPLLNRQSMVLVRLGQKLILLNVTAKGAQTLAEIDDPEQVRQMLAECESGRTVSDSFRQVLAEFEREKTEGFLDEEDERTPQRAASSRV